jgi:phosphopantothenoylcysteine decarboxylase/phosphopantothenate--cysteine ligase
MKGERMCTIALGVCSSISIYKACDVLRGFQKKGYEVQVIMTKNATRMVSPLLFSALSRRKVLVDPFEDPSVESIDHVELAKKIELFVVAPATANSIGKLAGGIADDFLSTFYMAVNSPVLVAPAMNEAMYLHKQTQANMQKLREWGVCFVEPEKGYLACREEGWGRLASPEKIVEMSLQVIAKTQSLHGKKVLVTAGPTREFLDPVRFVSNRSSGKMGYELAAEALRRGAEVVLISGPTQLVPPQRVNHHRVQTAQEMDEAVQKHFPDADILIMAAAVSDFKFSRRAAEKVKKAEFPEGLSLVPTEDILLRLSREKKQILVGFAAETENVERNALAKLKKKSLDMIVANDVLEEGIGFESDDNRVSLFFPDGRVVRSEKASKLEISRIILNEIEGIIGQTG